MELEKDNFVESVRDLPFSRLILLWGTYFSVFTHFTQQMISIYVFYLPFTNVFESSKYSELSIKRTGCNKRTGGEILSK